MATKHEIKKYLERKSLESTHKLETERNTAINEVVQEFISLHSTHFTKMKAHISGLCRAYDELVASIATDKTASVNQRNYSTAERRINEVSSCLSASSIKDSFVIQKKTVIEDRFKELISESQSEYVRLLAVIQTMSSKEGVELLKNLGFDVKNLKKRNFKPR